MDPLAPNKKIAVHRSLLWVLLFWSIVSFLPLSSQGEEPQLKETLLRLLPLEPDLKGWTLDEEIQTAQGVGLFDLINGGAEQYVKAGFSRAVIATYRKKQGKSINVEIYEMLSPESARSIYRKKAGDRGVKVSVGEEAAMEDHYLNFRKGSYQVTVSGYDTQEETIEGLLRIARLVAERISATP
jgi:hypothetical protein